MSLTEKEDPPDAGIRLALRIYLPRVVQMEMVYYQSYLALKEREYESICLRCGQCCGADNDPCLHLQRLADGSYKCNIYSNRPGTHKTIKGNNLTCVPIKELVKKGAAPYGCAYSRV
jgi:uncharacterized cysteine cluster protein YcgN (CxxCxxCC family)